MKARSFGISVSVVGVLLFGATAFGQVFGVIGQTNNRIGVFGVSDPVWTIPADNAGVYGVSSNSAGVEGASSFNFGVYGQSDRQIGVYGTSNNSYGVSGYSSCGTGAQCIGVYGSSTNGNGLWGKTTSTTNAAVVGVAPSGGLAFYGSGNIQVTGTASKPGGGPWAASSDARIKKDVREFDQGLNELMRVHPVRFKYNGLGGMADDGKEYAGVIAQELEKVMPTMVGTKIAKLRHFDTKETSIKTVDGNEFTYLLIKAVQEQQQIIAKQESRLAALEQSKTPVMSSSLLFGESPGLLAVGLLGVAFAIVRRKQGT